MAQRPRKSKVTPDTEVSGQQGVNVLEQVVLEMGYLWHPRGPFDAGIDGRLELRDTRTKEPLNRYIGAQSKGWAKYTAEDKRGFEFLCDEVDIDYWCRSQEPVLLVCSHPATREVWFKCVTDWFADAERRASRRVLFDKQADRLDASRGSDLMRLGLRAEPTVPRQPAPPPEQQVTNLLPILGHPRSIWSAPSPHNEPWQVRLRYEELEASGALPERRALDFILRDGRLYSPRDPRTCSLAHVCHTDQVERIDHEQWAVSAEPRLQRYWVELLRRTLLDQVEPALAWHPLRHVFYFPAPDPLAQLSIIGAHGAPRRVVKVGYYLDKTTNEQRLKYVRHHAFKPSFVRVDDAWHLAIEPDYLFTRDGEQETYRAGEYLAGIKRREKNLAVVGHLEMWGHVLTEPPSLFSERSPALVFGPLRVVEVPVGLDDKAWLGKERAEKAPAQNELAA